MDKINKNLENRFKELLKTGYLFRADVSEQEIWDAYISGFSEYPIFRDTSSSMYNCRCCRAFLKRYGNIVAINPETFEVMTLFDDDPDKEYLGSFRLLSKLIKKAKIKEIFVETLDYLLNVSFSSSANRKRSDSFILGCVSNVKRYNKKDVSKWPNSGIKEGQIITFNHLHLEIPFEFVKKSTSAERVIRQAVTKKKLLERGLREITVQTIEQVIELEHRGALLNGSNFINIVKKLKTLSQEFNDIPEERKDSWLWLRSCMVNPSIATFRNSAIESLMLDLEEGKSLEDACRSFNIKVDPTNYMKASAPITQKMVDSAKECVESLDLTSAT